MKRSQPKILFCLLCIALLLLSACSKAQEAQVYQRGKQQYQCGEYLYCLLSDGNAEVIGYLGDDTQTEITIPSQLDGYKVTSIGEKAFDGSEHLENVIIPEGVTTIGDYAFSNCKYLESVTIPDSVRIIGMNPFLGSDWFEQVIMSPRHPAFATINGALFEKAEKKLICCFVDAVPAEYTIPQGIKSIGKYAFANCQTSMVVIPDSVTTIEDWAFYGCGITTITIPDSVTSIGVNPFCYCSDLAEIVISPTHPVYEVIGWVLLNKQENKLISCLSSYPYGEISITRGITSIGDGAFLGCDKLNYFVLPDSIVSIGDEAFTLREDWFEVEEASFSHLYAEKNNYGYSIADFSEDTPVYFSGDFAYLLLEDGTAAIGAYNNEASHTEVVIPDTLDGHPVTAILSETFSDCSSMKKIMIPNTVTYIGNEVFDGCSSLISIDLPENLEFIGLRAFRDCSSLMHIDIPVGISKVKAGTFSGCESLTHIALPDGLTEIGYEAFGWCYALTNITIPDSVTVIGDSVFSSSGLQSITIPGSVNTIEEDAFFDCDDLQSVTICDGVTTIEPSAFSNCESLASIVIPDSVTDIDDDAFYKCYAVTLVVNSNSYAETYAIMQGIPFRYNEVPPEGKQTLDVSGEYVGMTTSNEFISVTIPQSTDEKAIVKINGDTLEGKYQLEEEQVIITMKGQKMVGFINGDEIAFDEATVKRGLDLSTLDLNNTYRKEFYTHFNFYSWSADHYQRLICGFSSKWHTDYVSLYAGCSGATDVAIVPSVVHKENREYRVVLRGPTGEGGLYDTICDSRVHTLLIGDGVEVWEFFGYGNDNLLNVCLPDDANGIICCDVEHSMLQTMYSIKPDITYYVIEGSSAHHVCEQLNLPYRFRKTYSSVGLVVDDSLKENDPILAEYIESLP